MNDMNIDEIIESESTEFSINDDNTADWAVRTIKQENEERDRLISIAQDQIDELTDRIADIKKKYGYKTAFLESLLGRYFDTVPHSKTKTQESYKLLSGSLVLTKPKVSIEKPDENSTDFINYVKTHAPKYIKTTETVNWGEYKKTLKAVEGVIIDENGEIVDGLSCVAVPPKFSVK